MGVVSNITRRRHLTDLQRSWRLNNLSHCWTLLRIVEHCWAFLTNLSHCSMQRAKLGGWAMPRRRYQLNHPLCTLVHTVHNLANKKTSRHSLHHCQMSPPDRPGLQQPFIRWSTSPWSTWCAHCPGALMAGVGQTNLAILARNCLNSLSDSQINTSFPSNQGV